jgi:hypothetical protein
VYLPEYPKDVKNYLGTDKCKRLAEAEEEAERIRKLPAHLRDSTSNDAADDNNNHGTSADNDNHGTTADNNLENEEDKEEAEAAAPSAPTIADRLSDCNGQSPNRK